MAELGDILGGQATTSYQQPGANDPGFEERKQGWLQTLKQAVAQPETALFLTQAAMNMTMPRAPGMSTTGHIVNSLGQGAAAVGRMSAGERQRADELQKRQVTERQNQQRIDFEGQRAQIERERLARDREAMGLDEAYRRDKLKTDAELTREEIAGRKAVAGMNRGAGTAQWDRQMAQLKEEFPNMSFSQRQRLLTELTSNPVAKEAAIQRLASQMVSDSILTGETLSYGEAVEKIRRNWANVGTGGSPPSPPPTPVKTEEEALRLPPGTRVVFPDGRTATVQ